MQFKSGYCVDIIDLKKFMPLPNLHKFMTILPRKMKRSITDLLLHKPSLVKNIVDFNSYHTLRKRSKYKSLPVCSKYFMNILCLKTLL